MPKFTGRPSYAGISVMTPPLPEVSHDDLQAWAGVLITYSEDALRRTTNTLAGGLQRFLPLDHDAWSETTIRLKQAADELSHFTLVELADGAPPPISGPDSTIVYASREVYLHQCERVSELYTELRNIIIRLDHADQNHPSNG